MQDLSPTPDASLELPVDPRPKKVFIRTFGCQMNVYDTGKMKALLARHGYAPTEELGEADLVIANTCSIREKPEQKVHSFLGQARMAKRRRLGDLTIAVAGCVAQQEGQRLLDRYPDLDLVFGPDAIPRIGELVQQARSSRVVDTRFLDEEDYVFAPEIDPDAGDKITGFVTIQKGCDNKCTFCVVPSTRGAELSRPSEEILDEVRGLVGQGVREITLIGQNVNSYGLKVSAERSFARLLYAVSEIEGVRRIRYTTSHPRDIGPDVIQAYRDLPQLTSHLHLPVQSGSDPVLRRMKRFYTRDQYLRLVDSLIGARPDLALTTDFIIGFPGETEADFEQTMCLLEAVRFHASFSFKYSPRPGTPALKLLDRGEEVEEAAAQARLERLQARQKEISIEVNEALVGSEVELLVEGPSRHDEGIICGRTSSFKMVNFLGDLEQVGSLVQARLIRAFPNSFRGELL